MPLSGDANHATVPGVLRAFNAENLTQQLWNSTLAAVDNPQNFTKGTPPVVYGPALDDEAETAPIAGSTVGRTVRAFSDSPLSRGQGEIIEAHAVGDFIAFTLSIPHTGNYGIRTRMKMLNNRGIWQLSIDGVNHGAAQDGFAGAVAYPEVDLGVRALTGGTHTFRFQVTGRNASSTDFWIALDYIKIVER